MLGGGCRHNSLAAIAKKNKINHRRHPLAGFLFCPDLNRPAELSHGWTYLACRFEHWFQSRIVEPTGLAMNTHAEAGWQFSGNSLHGPGIFWFLPCAAHNIPVLGSAGNGRVLAPINFTDCLAHFNFDE